MLTVVVGGFFGSEAKGSVSARLCADRRYGYAVRVGGPNAGHCVVNPDSGVKHALRQIPVAAVVDPYVKLVIAAGSEIDLAVLRDEVESLEKDGVQVRHRLLIDSSATILTEVHHAQERDLFADGHSTKKGIGAARADRVMRTATLVGQAKHDFKEYGEVLDTQPLVRKAARQDSPGSSVFLEGTQGYGLGSHAGYYPHCTSGDCRAIDFMAAAGIGPITPDEVWLTLRMHPIRIAGDSGPLARETSWEELGVPPEYTTVTKKERRVGEWDWDLARASADANRPGYPGRLMVALMFVDYVWPSVAGMDDRRTVDGHGPRLPEGLMKFGRIVESRLAARVGMLGTGPATQIKGYV